MDVDVRASAEHRSFDVDFLGSNRVSRFGPLVDGNKTTFRLWAPSLQAADCIIDGRDPVAMHRADDGFLLCEVTNCGPGTRYKFRAGDLDLPGLGVATARWRRRRLEHRARAVDPGRRKTPLRPWHESVICEVHVGTVSPEGTFDGLRRRLEHFRDAGYTCLEIMPVNEFPGTRNWGYDGTLIFAPESAYGTPEELRALVDRAHELGLCMVLDVVYNHFGEVDNFVEHYAPEWFDEEIETRPGDRASTSTGRWCASSTTRTR